MRLKRRRTYYETPESGLKADVEADAEPACASRDDQGDDDQDDVRLAFLRPVDEGQRPYTLHIKQSQREIRSAALVTYPAEVERPQFRSECESSPRPCPFVSCAHHLYLDVNEDNGHIKFNYPHLEVWELTDSCSLDIADQGGLTLEQTGKIIGLTRERIRQVELMALTSLKRQVEASDVDDS